MNIVKTIVAAVALSAVLFGSWAGTQVAVEYLSYSSPRSYVVAIGNGSSGGSGVVLAPRLVLTAAHVVGPKGEGYLIDGKPVKVVAYDAKLDLALLEVEGVVCPCAPLGTLPAVDDEVVVVGFPLGVGQYATEGRIQFINFNETRLEQSAPIIFGNSGGGMFAFQGGKWKLVGIMVEIRGLPIGPFVSPVPVIHMSRAVPIVNIFEFMHRPTKSASQAPEVR